MSIRPLGLHRFLSPAPKVYPAAAAIRFGEAGPENPGRNAITASSELDRVRALHLRLPSLKAQEGELVLSLARWAGIAAKAVEFSYPYPAADGDLRARLNTASQYFATRTAEDVFQEHPGVNLKDLLKDVNVAVALVRERMNKKPGKLLDSFVAFDADPKYPAVVPKALATFIAASLMLGKVRDGFLDQVRTYNTDGLYLKQKNYQHAPQLSVEAWDKLDFSL